MGPFIKLEPLFQSICCFFLLWFALVQAQESSKDFVFDLEDLTDFRYVPSFSIQELEDIFVPHAVSNDIDLDICKARKYCLDLQLF